MNRKIFHVSTSLKGGAGIAALNLHATLIDQGVESVILTLDSGDEKYLPNIVSVKRNIYERFFGKSLTFLQQHFNSYTFFSTYSCSSRRLLGFLLATSSGPKVLHIHNWYNFFNIKWLAQLENHGFEIVFTLHDQRLMTGGCHYSKDCKKFETECISCPLAGKFMRNPIYRNQQRNLELLKEVKNLRVVTPSLWLKKIAMKSKILRNTKISVIPNIFPTNGRELQRREPIHERSKLIRMGVASMYPFAEIKGGQFIKKLMTDSNGIELLFLKDFHGRADEFWKEIQILLVPSLQDNSPNVIHEAKQVGVPVIGTKVGGIPELLSERYDLVVDSPMTVNMLTSALPNYLKKLAEIPDLAQLITSDYAKFANLVTQQYLSYMDFGEK